MRFPLLIFFSAAWVHAFENHESKMDAAALQVDGYFGYPEPAQPLTADFPFGRAYGYSFFPLMKIGGRDLAGSGEFSLMNREFRDGAGAVNFSLLQSYGVGLGYSTVDNEFQNGFIYGLFGINGDMRKLDARSFYGDWSYMHIFTLSNRLALGGGIDVHFYFEEYYPYPLLYVDWRLANHTKVQINFDTGEIKQFLTGRLSVSLGTQYDIFHYALGDDGGYVQENSTAMARVEYRAGENVYVRLSVKKPYWGEETLTPASGTQVIETSEGFSVRVQAAYGM